MERRLALAFVVGMALRIGLVLLAPRWGYPWDHFDVLGMGEVAAERGLAHAYSAPPDALPTIRGWIVQNGTQTVIARRSVYPPNYPPLATTVFWVQSRFLGVGAPDFVANTAYSRLVTSLVPWLFELVTALGVGLLTGALGTSATTAATAAIVTWLAPPFMMNTGVFGQYDALAVAPAVLAVFAMVRGRWLGAGVAAGVALLAKPQGLLVLPIAAFAAAVATPSGVVPFLRRLATVGAAALTTVAIGSAPWMLADGFAWLARCYRMNLFEVLSYTTLEAYNVWYLVALIAERHPVYDVLTSTVTVAGLTRDAWGRIFLLVASLAVATLLWRGRRRSPAVATVLFAGLWLFGVFMWPTRVHERYVLYCLPFFLVAAAALPRFRPIAAALLVLATMEHGWPIWRSGPGVGTFDRHTVERFHDQRFQEYWQGRTVTMENAKAGPKPEESLQLAFARHRADRAHSLWLEWTLTLLSLGAYVAALVVAARESHDDEVTDDVIRSA